MLLIGIDDAGRGPIIGPMVMAGVLIEKEQENDLKKLGAKDSKLLSHPQRIAIAGKIGETIRSSYLVIAEPSEIDKAVLGGENLNTLEARKMAEIINNLNEGKKPTKVIVDCPSVNLSAWRAKLLSFIKKKENLDVVCEHKADFNHPVVSAASILAKVHREEQVMKIKKKYGEIGSGYPADPYTKKFLEEHGKELEDSGIFRKSWATWKALFPEDSGSQPKQAKLF